MTLAKEAQDIFTDAKQMDQSAIKKLDASDIRDAAEKAWCGTL